MDRISSKDVVIRVIREEDLDAMVNIDAFYSETERYNYYERRTRQALSDEAQLKMSLVAVVHHKVVGFIMGQIYLGEFGIPETTATIDTIGVHPEFRRHGVARMLAEQFLANARAVGIKTLHTLVNWNNWELLRFFDSVGFVPAKTLSLEREL